MPNRINIKTYTDQMGRQIACPFPPKRVVSLVPSQTELLIHLGVSVVGRTKFCIHPKEQITTIPTVGGTKNFHFDKIKLLNPDLIIGNKEENYREGIEQLSEDFPIWISDIFTIQDAFSMIQQVGELTNTSDKANELVNNCKLGFEQIKNTRKGTVLYLIWKNPYMCVGQNTFIDNILQHLGFTNCITKDRYTEISEEEISQLNPDYIFFSSEPFPFKGKHVLEAQKQFPNSKSMIVDGEMFSWYGSRMLEAVESYFPNLRT